MTFYGDSNYFTDAGNCEIKNYKKVTDCYCAVRSGSDCIEFEFIYSCGQVLESSYQSKLEASYVIAILCILSVFGYAVLTCSLICCPGDYVFNDRMNNGIYAGQLAVPTTATVRPTVVEYDDNVQVAMVTIGDHNDTFQISHQVDGSSKDVVTAEAVTLSDQDYYATGRYLESSRSAN